MKINQLLYQSTKLLESQKIPSPLLDAEVLLTFVLKKPREFILAHPDYQLTQKQINNFNKLIQRRALHEPIAYITNQKEFFGLDFYIDENVLIPRPESELLVELVMNITSARMNGFAPPKKIIDVGTGSGCIAISLAKNLPETEIIATDISPAALKIAQKNSQTHNTKNIKFLQGDLLTPAKDYINKEVTVVANLPYLSKKLYDSSPRSVQDFEPFEALESGDDGLDHYRRLFKQVEELNIPCYVFCEISPEQKVTLEDEINGAKFYKDLSGKWRIMEYYSKV